MTRHNVISSLGGSERYSEVGSSQSVKARVGILSSSSRSLIETKWGIVSMEGGSGWGEVI